jgi:hypothetical protein
MAMPFWRYQGLDTATECVAALRKNIGERAELEPPAGPNGCRLSHGRLAIRYQLERQRAHLLNSARS